MDEKRAFWLSPLAATIPLIPIFSLPWSPLFLGKLDPAGPFLRPGVGPWLAALAVIFDATLLAYLMGLPLYLLLFGSRQSARKLSFIRILILFAVAGVVASQFAHAIQNFKQPGLREFAVSWLSPILGCICGLTAGASFFALISANRRFSFTAQRLVSALPVLTLIAAGAILVLAR